MVLTGVRPAGFKRQAHNCDAVDLIPARSSTLFQVDQSWVYWAPIAATLRTAVNAFKRFPRESAS
jgi:hypothetical protein